MCGPTGSAPVTISNLPLLRPQAPARTRPSPNGGPDAADPFAHRSQGYPASRGIGCWPPQRALRRHPGGGQQLDLRRRSPSGSGHSRRPTRRCGGSGRRRPSGWPRRSSGSGRPRRSRPRQPPGRPSTPAGSSCWSTARPLRGWSGSTPSRLPGDTCRSRARPRQCTDTKSVTTRNPGQLRPGFPVVTLAKTRPKRLQYRPELLDGFLGQTELVLQPVPPRPAQTLAFHIL